MDFKKIKGSPSIVTRDLNRMSEKVSNIYECVVICSKRANQISVELKKELSAKLEEFASYTDNLEEVFDNREQIEVSRYYERLPKPVLIAIDEFIKEELTYSKEIQTKDFELNLNA